MSKSFIESATQMFRAQRPLWACEFTSRHAIVAGVDSARKAIAGKLASEFSSPVVWGSLTEKNIADPKAMLETVKEMLDRTGFRGSEITVIIPDDSARISLLTAESLPEGHDERDAFVRWKMKKSVPFDVDSAQVAFTILGGHRGTEGKGIDLLVALSPRAVVEEYENLMEMLELHCGRITPLSLAALNLWTPPKGDALFLKVAPGCITTTVFQHQRPRFYRRVSEMSLYDAVYPTILYHQDKLGGGVLGSVTVCGYDTAMLAELSELQEMLNIPVQKLGPKNIDDLYKPVLGAIGLTWSDLI